MKMNKRQRKELKAELRKKEFKSRRCTKQVQRRQAKNVISEELEYLYIYAYEKGFDDAWKGCCDYPAVSAEENKERLETYKERLFRKLNDIR